VEWLCARRMESGFVKLCWMCELGLRVVVFLVCVYDLAKYSYRGFVLVMYGERCDFDNN